MRIVTDKRRRNGAIAVLLMLSMVAVMISLASDHGLVLHQVRVELLQVQKNQERAWEQRWKRLSLAEKKGQPSAQPPGKGK